MVPGPSNGLTTQSGMRSWAAGPRPSPIAEIDAKNSACTDLARAKDIKNNQTGLPGLKFEMVQKPKGGWNGHGGSDKNVLSDA